MTDAPPLPAPPIIRDDDVIDAGGAALILGAAEAMLDRLPSDAFADDRLYARAQSLSEVLDAGMAVVDRSGRVNRLT